MNVEFMTLKFLLCLQIEFMHHYVHTSKITVLSCKEFMNKRYGSYDRVVVMSFMFNSSINFNSNNPVYHVEMELTNFGSRNILLK